MEEKINDVQIEKIEVWGDPVKIARGLKRRKIKMTEQRLWLRELNCGHSRPTNLAFINGNYKKPKIGEKCFCRECCDEMKIISVKELGKKRKNILKEYFPEIAKIVK